MALEWPDDITAAHPVQGDGPPPDPLALASAWLPGPGEDRVLMTLSTVEADGAPRARTVMLSEFDGSHFFFHTDALSRKVQNIGADPRVCLTILLAGGARQLVVQGTASRAAGDEEAQAYRARSDYLRALAWVNTPEHAKSPLAARVERWRTFTAAHPDPEAPESWAGFAVDPRRMLFWAGNAQAASRRREYVREASGWRASVLPG